VASITRRHATAAMLILNVLISMLLLTSERPARIYLLYILTITLLLKTLTGWIISVIQMNPSEREASPVLRA
jgi:hypothetical protein